MLENELKKMNSFYDTNNEIGNNNNIHNKHTKSLTNYYLE